MPSAPSIQSRKSGSFSAFLRGAGYAFFLIALPGICVHLYYDHINKAVSSLATLPVLQTMSDDFRTGRQLAGELFAQKAEHFYHDLTGNPHERPPVSVTPHLPNNMAWQKELTRSYLNQKLPRRKGRDFDAFLDYIDTFKPLAQRQMQKTGIPASIIMAQALLESNAGRAKLARETNNHFGIKCHAKPGFMRGGIQDGDFVYSDFAVGCYQCHDDVWWDRFEVYPSIEHSYRRHSRLLLQKRYGWMVTAYPAGNNYALPRPVYGRTQAPYYAAWSVGLKDSGYATAPKYAEKLILLIETYQLWRLDYEVIMT